MSSIKVHGVNRPQVERSPEQQPATLSRAITFHRTLVTAQTAAELVAILSWNWILVIYGVSEGGGGRNIKEEKKIWQNIEKASSL